MSGLFGGHRGRMPVLSGPQQATAVGGTYGPNPMVVPPASMEQQASPSAVPAVLNPNTGPHDLVGGFAGALPGPAPAPAPSPASTPAPAPQMMAQQPFKIDPRILYNSPKLVQQLMAHYLAQQNNA